MLAPAYRSLTLAFITSSNVGKRFGLLHVSNGESSDINNDHTDQLLGRSERAILATMNSLHSEIWMEISSALEWVCAQVLAHDVIAFIKECKASTAYAGSLFIIQKSVIQHQNGRAVA